MKKKFNLLTLLIFLFIIPFQAQAIDSKCDSLLKSISKNELNLVFDELDYFEDINTNYEFKTFYNLSTNEWEYKRDENNNLIIDRITDLKFVKVKAEVKNCLFSFSTVWTNLYLNFFFINLINISD